MIAERPPATGAAGVRPADLGQIFDGALNVYRRHFVTIVAALALIVVPLSLVRAALGAGTADDIVALVLAGVNACLSATIAALVVGDVAEGTPVTVGSVWRRLPRIVLPLFATSVIVALVVGLGFALLIVPGILFWVWFAFYAPIVALENRRYGDAMTRSRQLVSGSWWRVFGILALAGFLVLAAQLAVSLGVNALTSHNIYAEIAVAAAADLVVAPVYWLIVAMLYFDMRARRDGADLLAAIEALPR